jgi:hypothetical protein
MLKKAIRLEKFIRSRASNVGPRTTKSSQYSIIKLENHLANSL